MGHRNLSFISGLVACGFAAWNWPGPVSGASPQEQATHPLQVGHPQTTQAQPQNTFSDQSLAGGIPASALRLDLPLVIAQANPIAGLLTQISNSGGTVTLGGRNAVKGNEMRTPSDKLKVPANSRANIEFRSANSKTPIPNLLFQAGKADGPTEYWYSCKLKQGQFLIGWAAGNQPEKCDIEKPKPKNPARSQTNSTTDPSKDPAPFTDISSHWAQAEIQQLKRQGIISGYEDGTFRPNAPVTRAEFTAMLTKAFGDRSSTRAEQNFPDSSSHWASAFIRKAYSLGFISGYDDGSFKPGGNITRLEAIVALASGLKLTGNANPSSFYSDADQICGATARYGWACNQLNAASSNSIRIQGPNPDRFNPARPASRADIAVFIAQALSNTSSNTTGLVVQPVGQEIAWALVNVTNDKAEVTVLGGTVTVETSSNPQPVIAGERYTIQQDQAGTPQAQVTPLSSGELGTIANSPDVAAFLDTQNWSAETAAQLEQYKANQQKNLQTRGLAIQSVTATLVSRTSPTQGRIRIVGTIVNQGKLPYIPSSSDRFFFSRSVSGTAKDLGPGYQIPPIQRMPKLAPGETAQIIHEGDWDTSLGEDLPLGYKVAVVFNFNGSIGTTLNVCDDSTVCRYINREEINGLFANPPTPK